MAAFTEAEWAVVLALLENNGAKYGFPERRSDSVVLASFNIRKLGKVGNKSAGSWRFLARFCAACDLIAIQEVQDDLSALNHLKDLVNTESGGDVFGLVASDITGTDVARGSGMRERLAFLFRWERVQRTEVASDISMDRSAVLETLYEHRGDFAAAFEVRRAELHAAKLKYEAKMAAYEADMTIWRVGGEKGRRPSKPSLASPPFVLPHFVTFIRTPHCVSFRIPGAPGATPYEFLAVNAHLLYGDKSKQAEERRMEFFALIEWLSGRAKNVTNLYHKDLILFGDLNLDFDDPLTDMTEIEGVLKGLNKGELNRTGVKVNFPFLDVHPTRTHLPPEQGIFRTAARKEQTYDQIALFLHDKRLPRHEKNAKAGKTVDGFDYGVFDFVDLFAEAMHPGTQGFLSLSKQDRKALLKKFEHDLSDHMPIWIRLPLPA